MNAAGLIVIGALITGGVYVWRFFTAGWSEGVNIITPGGFARAWGLSGGPVVSPEGFLVAWGVTWLGVSLIAAFSAPLGAAFAVLIIVGDVLVNAAGVGNKLATLEAAKSLTRRQAEGLAKAEATIAGHGGAPSVSENERILEHAERGEAETAPGRYLKPTLKG